MVVSFLEPADALCARHRHRAVLIGVSSVFERILPAMVVFPRPIRVKKNASE